MTTSEAGEAPVPVTAPAAPARPKGAKLAWASKKVGALLDLLPLLGAGGLRALLTPLAVLGALFAIGCFVVVGVAHLRYPYEIEWMEGGLADASRHLLEGGKLYEAPTIDYTPYIYAPLYFYLGALVSLVVGPGLFAMRLISFSASMGAAILSGAIVWRETRSKLFTLLAPALFLATHRIGSSFMDLSRVDGLFVFLVLLTYYVLRFHRSARGQLVAAILATAAVFTKQSGLFIMGALCVWSLLGERKKGIPFALGTPILGAATFLGLNLYYDGWLYYFMFWIPRQHPSRHEQLYLFWPDDLMLPLGICVVAAIAFVALSEKRERGLYGAALFGSTITAWTGRIHAGGWTNVDIPLFATVALVGTLGLHLAAAKIPAPRGRAFALGAALAQFVCLAYDPRRLLPTEADRKAGDALVAAIQKLPGDEIFFPSRGAMLPLAGKKMMAQEMAIMDVIGIGGGKPGAALRADIQDSIAEGRYGGAVLESDFYRKEIEQQMKRSKEAVTGRDVFYTLAGMRTRPKSIYVKK